MIPIARTDITDAETEAVLRVMKSGRIAIGPEMRAFEKAFADYHDVPDAVMVNSGTSGLMVSLRAMGLGPGDEVIMPALTFVGTINSILAAGATPVLADVDPLTANLNPGSVVSALTGRTRAIMPVHLFGLPAQMADIMAIAEQHELNVVEDACEAIGATTMGRKAGAVGNAGVFGFFPNKPLTTGEGGMIIGRDQSLLDRCRAIINQGRGAGADVLGYSLRGTELGAAIGIEQLRTLDARLRVRAQLADRYHRALATLPEVSVPWRADASRSWFAMPVLLPANVDRDQVMVSMLDRGVETRDYFPALHTLAEWRERCGSGEKSLVRIGGPLRHSESLGSRLLCLPFWAQVEPHVDEIVAALAAVIRGSS